jgi:hypothetical protein
MASSSGSSSPEPPIREADITKKVIEYLVKKGYNRTEQTLRQESAHLDKDGRPIHNRIEELGNVKYSRGYNLLSNWIDQNLDVYKASCIIYMSLMLLTDRTVRAETSAMANLCLLLSGPRYKRCGRRR